MTTVADIAEAIAEGLNQAEGGTFSQPFKAVRKYVPAVDLEQLEAGVLIVTVYPRPGGSVEVLNRGGDTLQDWTIIVGIQKKLRPGTNPTSEAANPEIDALVALSAEVASYLAPNKPAGSATITRTLIEPVFNPEHLREKSVFTSAVNVAVKFL